MRSSGLLASLLLSQAAMGATDLYVALNGNDGNAGSISSPLATVQAARDKIRGLTTNTTICDGATEMTLSVWVYPDTKSSNKGILSATGDYFGLLFSGYGTGNPAEFRAMGNGLRAPDNSCPAGQWSHIAGVWKSGTIHKIYVDGVEVANNASPPTGTVDTDIWLVGTDRGIAGRNLDGTTKGVYVYTRALSASEVASLAADPPTVASGSVMSLVPETIFNGAQSVTLNQNPLDGGVNIYLRAGRYSITSTVTLDAQDSGKSGSPVTYKAYPGEEVILDGSKMLPTTGFTLVTDSATLARLNPDAQSNVYAATLTDSTLIAAVKDPDAQLSLDDQMLQQSRFPNIGFTFGDSIDRSGEVDGALGTDADPKGAIFTPRHTPKGNWNAELNRLQKARCRGYVSAMWKNETLRIDAVSTAYRVALMDGSSYGFGKDAVNRPYVDNLLCEIDEPGEWYFDDLENKLYMWPLDGAISGSNVLGVWDGPDMFTINGDYIRLENLIMQCAGNSENAFVNMYGRANVAAGCTFRYCPPGTVSFNIYDSARESGAQSCNFFDIDNASRLYAGSLSNDEIQHGDCFIENCHFTQIYSKNFYGKVTALNNAGNRFRHNLMHNHNGQIATVAGVEHLVEYNECFNTGVEEGDGGAFYSGASFSSFANVFQNNFFHHIICIPQLYSRASIFSDDGDCGEEVYNNVFYKAGDSFKTNQGAGHYGTGNVSLDSINAVYVINGAPTTMYNSNMTYLNTDPMSGDKDNILGRGMRHFGVDGWDTTINSGNWNTKIHSYWRNRFPRLDTMMNTFWSEKAMNKHNEFKNTVVYSNDTGDGISAPTATLETNTKIIYDMNDFVDPSTLNFKYKSPLPSWAAENNFEQIGLYTDAYRTSVPDKDDYRSQVRARWDGVASGASGSYDPNTINDRIYYNSGKMIFGIVDPPQATVVDLDATSYSYDLGTATSPVMDGWTRIRPDTNGDVSWSTTVDARDRGVVSGVNNINRDFIFGSATTTFEHKLAPGIYAITMNMGDAITAHDNMVVKAEGIVQHADVDNAAGSFPYANFTVTVTDGSLSIEFSDNGGTDPNWVVTRLSITKTGEAVDLTQTKYDYDLGPVDAPVMAGWTAITPDSSGEISWSTTVPAVDRGAVGSVNLINRDLIYSSSPAILNHKIANGSWQVTMNMGDATTAHDQMAVGAEGVTMLTDLSNTAGTNPYAIFKTFVSDGEINISFDDEGGSDANWVVNRLTLTKLDNPSKPVATPQSVSADAGVAKSITLSGTDADGDNLSYTVLTQPANGTLSGTAPNLSYTATAGYSGSDSFTFKVNDGTVDSDPATVSISVSVAVTAPAAPSALSATASGTSTVNLSWTDNSNNEDNFKIDRKVGTGSWASLTTLAAGVTSYSNTGLNDGTLYTYRVYAANAVGNSAFSAEVSATTDSAASGDPIPGRFEAEDYKTGGEGVGYHDTTAGNAGNTYRTDDVDIEARDGGYNVGWTATGEWLAFDVNATAGIYDIVARVATTSTGKQIDVTLDGTSLGIFTLPNTGNWAVFQEVTLSSVSIPDGAAELRFTFVNGGCNLNWIEFQAAAVTSPPTGTDVMTVDTAETLFNYDFGTTNSVVMSGWTRISPQAGGGITWSAAVNAADRGLVGTVNNINRDFVYSSNAVTLEHKVANGSWHVVLNMGDATTAHDDMIVKAEGITKASNIDSAAAAFPYATFDADVTDGSLSLEFSEGGGSDANWVVTRMSLSRNADAAPIGSMVAFKAQANNKYVCSDNRMDSVNRTLLANRTAVGAWEKFTVEDAGDGYVSLVANYNSKYVRADAALDAVNLPLAANHIGTLTDAEKYMWWDNGDGTVSLQSKANSKFVAADQNLDATNWPTAANTATIESTSKFTVEVQ